LSTIFAQLAICTIFFDEVVHAKVESATSTVFRQAHNIGMMVHIYKKHVRVAESKSRFCANQMTKEKKKRGIF